MICHITGTTARIVDANSIAYLKPVSSSRTDIMLHSLQTGTETVAATLGFSLPLDNTSNYSDPWESASWRPDGSLVAYSVQPTDSSPGSRITVWLYSQQLNEALTTYPLPLVDCICRFGLPDPTSELSPDGQYLVSGWPLGKGAEPFVVSRVSDRSRVATMDLSVVGVLWDRTGHRLFLIGDNTVRAWTPDGGITTLAGARQWSFMPSLSPDGKQVVYTAYTDDSQTQLRVFVYDFPTASTRMLSAQSRSEVLFAKTGWVWYLDEPGCDATHNQSGLCGPWQSAPSGRVFAQDLATGRETQVNFAPGEAPVTSSDVGAFEAQDLWPLQ